MSEVTKRKSEIKCDKCGAILRTVALANLQRTLDEMELSLTMCTAMCPDCGKVNIVPGFSEMKAYTCQKCGLAVETGES